MHNCACTLYECISDIGAISTKLGSYIKRFPNYGLFKFHQFAIKSISFSTAQRAGCFSLHA